MSEVFSGRKGRFVSLEDTVNGFRSLLDGEGDEYPEAAFYMMGTMEEALEEGAGRVRAALDRVGGQECCGRQAEGRPEDSSE